MVFVMKKLAWLALAPAAVAVFAAHDALAQTRYSTPPPVTLSPDLTAPWVLQLSNKPGKNRRYSVELAAPRAKPAPAYRIREAVSAMTPLQADPVRRKAVAEPVSVRSEEPRKKKPEYDPQFEMQIVSYDTPHAPGTIVIDTSQRFLYLVEADGMARRYGVGVGREGFEWSGTNKVTRKAEWPGWTPPPEMIAREKKKGKILPAHMEGGPDNPLGARAIYLGDTLYRIHGTNQPWSIGKAVSSGCIRMRNEDVIDLYERIKIGTKVVVS